MIGYVTIGTCDLQRAAAFYDALLAELGGVRFMETNRFISWTTGPGTCGLAVTYPYDRGQASTGNGTMIALQASCREKVDRVHSRAIELGAQDEGPVGERGYGFYVGYFRDLDGNKLNVYYFGTA